MAVDLDNVAVDIESFLGDVSAGQSLIDAGETDEALERLSAAEAAYGGDFLEEQPYDEWAVGLREEARAAYIGVLRALADLARASDDIEGEIRFRLRLLERDAFDEATSFAFVRAHIRQGAHGQARAAYRRYVAAMEEIDVEAVPYPS